MPYLWAAYRMGTFGHWQVGLSRQEFSDAVFSTVAGLLQGGGDAFALIGYRKDTLTTAPMGLVVMTAFHGQAWPHAYWFPWASGRNRIECAVHFLNETKERSNCVIVAADEYLDFFRHLCRYGVIRRIGPGRDWLPGIDVTLFETVRRVTHDGFRRGPVRPGRD